MMKHRSAKEFIQEQQEYEADLNAYLHSLDTCGCPTLVGLGKTHGPGCPIKYPVRVRCPGCSLQVGVVDGRIVEHGISLPRGNQRCRGSQDPAWAEGIPAAAEKVYR